jgi:GNAT superfamily N-acetyltransferase
MKHVDINFRDASEQDVAHIVALKIAMFEEAQLQHLLAVDAAECILADYVRLYAQHTAQHFVACDASNQIVGMAGAFLKSDLPFRYYAVSRYGFLGDVYTIPRYRGSGVATRLSQSAISWLSKHGVTMIRLLASNAARPVYERLGFEASDEMVLKLPKSLLEHQEIQLEQ